MRTLSQLLRAVLIGALILTAGFAAEDAKKTYDIPAGDAAAALKQFSALSGRETLFAAEAVRGVKTPAVRGELTVQEAIDALLADTGLIATADEKSGAIAVRRESAVEAKNDASRRADALAADGEGATHASRSRSHDGTVVLDTYEVFGRKSINADIPRTRDDVQPYVVFDRRVIENSMATNLDEFFRTRLPMNQSSAELSLTTSNPITLRGLPGQTLILLDGRRVPPRASSGAFTTQGDINGIPLSMIERIEVLPSTASGIYGGGALGGVINIITRKDYSGFEVSLSYQNPFDTDASIRRAELNGTLQLEGGKTMLTLNYSRVESSRLLVQDRDLVARGRALQLANNPAAFYGVSTPPVGYTTNIRNATGQNLVLVNDPNDPNDNTPLNSPFTFVPVGYTGPGAGGANDRGAALVANAGRYNLDLPDTISGRRLGLLRAPEQESYGVTLRRSFGERVELMLDASRFDNHGYQNFVTVTSQALLPVGSPHNPFTTPIIVTFPTTGLDNPGHSRSVSERMLAGVAVKLPADWSVGFDYVWTRSVSSTSTRSYFVGDPDGTGPGLSFAAALANGTLNVMRDLNAFPLNYDPYVLNYPDTTTRFALRGDEFTLRGSGPIFALPGGDVMLSTSAQYREEKILSGVRTNATAAAFGYLWDPSVGLESTAYVAEVRIPVFAETAAAGWRRGLEFQVAVRRDEATSSGLVATSSVPVPGPDGPFPTIPYVERDYAATKSTVGFKYAPAKDLALRASWGTGFLVPSITNLSTSTPASIPLFLMDPKRGNQVSPNPVTLLLGGNPDVRPEESESMSAGVIFTPRFLPGLRLSIDFTRIIKTDEISGLPSFDAMLAYEDRLPGLIVRAPLTPADQALGYTGGEITQMDFRAFNLAGKRVTAWDFQADYTWKSASWGEFQAYATATYQPELQTKAFSDLPYQETVGDVNTLQWRGNGGLNWTKGNLSIGWNMQYFDAYLSYSRLLPASSTALSILNQGSPKIPEQIYHDLQVRYQWGANLDGWQRFLANTQVTVGVQNVFNELPPAIATTSIGSGGYSPFGDPRLARYTLSVRKRF